MITLEKIRAEIQTKYDDIPWRDNDYDYGWLEALEWVLLEIIDKYAERQKCDTCYHNKTEFSVCQYCTDGDKYEEVSQEPTSPCDLCRFDYIDGVCGDCPAMAKAEWER